MFRIFEQRLRQLMNELTGAKTNGGGIFGQCVAYIASIEFQKRGNPHAHILLWIEGKLIILNFITNFCFLRCRKHSRIC